MPENTNNDAPDADRPTARAGQEGPGKTGAPAQPPSQAETERAAQEAVRHATKGATEGKPPEPGSPTDMAP
jgi:hypothetical protein